MGCCRCITTTLLTLMLLIGGLYYLYPCLFNCNQKSELNIDALKLDDWFGQQHQLKAGQAIPNDPVNVKPFKLNVSDAVLNDLRNRLKTSRFIDHLPGSNFEYGFNSEYLKIVQRYWLNNYQWRKHEQQVNSFNHFQTQIEGLQIHFIHVKPLAIKDKQVIPVLLIHGWPGSFYEYIKALPMLTEQQSSTDNFVYEIILPSLPGYGYSEQPHKPGFNIPAASRILVKLMKRLGHDRFITHGGDWGSVISLGISGIYPENVRGMNLIGNFYQPSTICDYTKMLMAYLMPKYFFGGDDYQKQWSKLYPFGEKVKSMLNETGYMHIQATRPDTVAAGLMDSPIGMAAYILEKFAAWTNADFRHRNDGGLVDRFSMDELLTNVMIYWTSENIAASQRFYLENMQHFDLINQLYSRTIEVPTSILEPSHDLMKAPRKMVEHRYKHLIQFIESAVGGHFLAFEQPKVFVDDLKKFTRKLLEFEQQQHETKQAETAKDRHVEM